MNTVRKILVVVSTILLCVVFGLMCYFALDNRVKADTIIKYSTSPDFNQFYVITNDKLTNNSNNVYNANSNVNSTIKISNTDKLLSGGNYLFLNKIGLNFTGLSQNRYNEMPERFNYHYNQQFGAHSIFYFNDITPDPNGEYFGLDYGLTRDLTFVKYAYATNCAIYAVYLDLNNIDIEEDLDLGFITEIENGSFSITFNSLFTDRGLFLGEFNFIPYYTSTSFMTSAFNSIGYTFAHTLTNITYTDCEFDVNIHFNWDYVNSYYGNINFIMCENFALNNNDSRVANNHLFTQFTYKSNNGNLVIFPDIPTSYGRNPVIDSIQYQNMYSLSITSVSGTGLLLTDIDSIHTDNNWTNDYLRKYFCLYTYNQNLSSNMIYVDTFNNDYSSGLYKSDVAWYDIFGHLYNFLIYLIFDMPLISNITKPIYMLISSTTSTFNWLAGCVAGLGIFGAFAMVYLLFAIIKRFL